MSLAQEYLNQFKWRDWQRALSLCPIEADQRILDLGCGTGDFTAALASRGASVLGIDSNPELLVSARERFPDCAFEQQDLHDLRLPSYSFDGLWCSFTAAYLPNFEQTFARWIQFLKPSAWVCLIEIDDLLNHEPLSKTTLSALERFYEDAIAQRRYDFHAGSKLSFVLESKGFQVKTVLLADQEPAFDGPASLEVLDAWRSRLKRMTRLQAFFGADYPALEAEFSSCLVARDHRSLCKVTCCVGSRPR